jgi:hypothetical protein
MCRRKKVEVVISWIVRYQMKTQTFSNIIKIHNNSYVGAMVLSQHISCIPSIKARMDTAHGNNAMPPPPLTLPTPIRAVTERGGESVPTTRFTGQNRQPGARAAAALDTPPPLRIIVQETGTSAISSLSTSRNSRTNAHTASASQYTQLNEEDVDLSDS